MQKEKDGLQFYDIPLHFKNSTNGSVLSFSTTFVFEIIPKRTDIGSNGMVFVISPSNDFQKALPDRYLGLLNDINIGNSLNHIIVVKLDNFQDLEFKDIDDNHVGVNINNLESIISARTGYFPAGKNGIIKYLNLKRGNPMLPDLSLSSVTLDLSPVMLDRMYVGFSISGGIFTASYYILGWSFKMNDQVELIDIILALAIVLPFIGFLILLVLISGALLISKVKDWEVQYGPYKFNYIDLSIATKGFKDTEILGKEVFGRVYRDVLPASNIQVTVKRVDHDSRQRMREFVVEIATIGCLRNPNLVRLLVYSQRK
ncbi:unnamed protein product [Camellia sinensis]